MTLQNPIILAGLSVNQTVLLFISIFILILIIYALSKIFHEQWSKFWGTIGNSLARFFWFTRLLLNRFIDFIKFHITGNIQHLKNQIKAWSQAIDKQKSLSPETSLSKIEELQKKIDANLKKIAEYEEKEKSGVSKYAKTCLANAAKEEKRLEELLLKLKALEENSNLKIKKTELDKKLVLDKYNLELKFIKEEIELRKYFAEGYKLLAQANQKQAKTFLKDRKIKLQHFRKDKFEQKDNIIKKYYDEKFSKWDTKRKNIKSSWSKKSDRLKSKISIFFNNTDAEISEIKNKAWKYAPYIIYIPYIIVIIVYYIFKFATKFIADVATGLVGFIINFALGIINIPFAFIRGIKRRGKGFVYEFKNFFTVNLKSNIKGYLYIAPVLVILGIFTFYPIINTFLLSFKERYNYYLNSWTGWGFSGYKKVLDDPMFRQALKNTMFIVFVSVPISVVIALLLSVALNSIKRFQGFFQAIFFLPYVTNPIAIGLVFKVIFGDGDTGLFNAFLKLIGVNQLVFFGSGQNPNTQWINCMMVIIIMGIWDSLAFKIMVFLSGMQNINKQYYQAAKIDGTSKTRTFFKITVPMISPMIAYITITSFIGVFKTYTSIVSLYGESYSPYGRGLEKLMITIVGYILEKFNNIGIAGSMTAASAGSVILLGIILLFTGIQMYVSNKKVHY